jgi:hypothetical protein
VIHLVGIFVVMSLSWHVVSMAVGSPSLVTKAQSEDELSAAASDDEFPLSSLASKPMASPRTFKQLLAEGDSIMGGAGVSFNNHIQKVSHKGRVPPQHWQKIKRQVAEAYLNRDPSSLSLSLHIDYDDCKSCRDTIGPLLTTWLQRKTGIVDDLAPAEDWQVALSAASVPMKLSATSEAADMQGKREMLETTGILMKGGKGKRKRPELSSDEDEPARRGRPCKTSAKFNVLTWIQTRREGEYKLIVSFDRPDARLILASYGFLWIPMDSYGSLWIPMEFLWIPMDSYGFLWIPMDSYGFLWIPMDSYGFLWIPMDPMEFLWIPMDSYGFLWISMEFLWIPMDSYGFPWNFMDSYRIPMDSYGFL